MSAPDRTNGHGSRPGDGARRGLEGPIAPPQNLEAEQSVLGAVLLSDTALPALIIDERLHPDDFYREGHGRIYKAMLDLHTLGEPVDALTLVEHLKQAGDLETVGGRAAIDLLAGSVPAVGNVRQYARIVRDNAMLRRLLRASYEIQTRVHSHEALPRDLVEPGRAVALEEQARQVPLLPAAPEERPGAGDEEDECVLLPRRPGLAHGGVRPRLLPGLVLVVQREVQVGLATEVVVHAPDTAARAGHHVGHVGLRVAHLAEDVPRCLQECRPGIPGPPLCHRHRHSHLHAPPSRRLTAAVIPESYQLSPVGD